MAWVMPARRIAHRATSTTWRILALEKFADIAVYAPELELEPDASESCPPHRIRIDEADGTTDALYGYCVKKCGFSRTYSAWVDPYLNMDAGDIVHDLIFKYTRPGEERI